MIGRRGFFAALAGLASMPAVKLTVPPSALAVDSFTLTEFELSFELTHTLLEDAKLFRVTPRYSYDGWTCINGVTVEEPDAEA